MSTTLTNGLKLPDKGSVDWYVDMQNNYAILDGAVSTVAEHSTQIAGKAPLVHTHTKSDVTDLLNSNFIPSANNTYDLGSSSYQWNNLYVKNYFYNGTAWGLDKANEWTRDNTFKRNIYQNQGDTNYIIPRGTSTVKGDLTTSGSFSLMFKDKNNGNLATSGISYLSLGQNSSGSYATIGVETVGSTDNTRHSNSISYKIDPTTNDNTAQFYPVGNNATDLGTSTNKWKSLNGVNPGALSLPNVRANVADPVDTVNWNLTGSRNKYTPTEDGWFFIRVAGTDGCSVNVHSGGSNNDYPTWTNSSTIGDATLVVPAEKGITLYVYVKATSISYCSFRPCLGNV